MNQDESGDDMMKLKKILRAVHSALPLFAEIALVLCALCGILHAIICVNPTFADWFNGTGSAFFRAVLGYITLIFPFSLAETMIISIPVWAAVLCVVLLRRSKRSRMTSVRCVTGLLSAVTLFYSSFVLTFVAGYHGSTLEQRLGLERKPVSAEQLETTAEALLRLAERELDDITFAYNSSSAMPYSIRDMAGRVSDAYVTASDRYSFIPRLHTKTKSIALSVPMTYTHISGVYTFFTGEANININFPDYTLPYTAAHELSHQRGIAREDEANFMAFLVCEQSDDPYIRYSGYLNLFEYVMNALYSANRDKYNTVYASADSRIRGEMRAYSEFYRDYAHSVAGKVSSTVNNAFLKSQGQTEGTRSYGRVVDLAVAYFGA